MKCLEVKKMKEQLSCNNCLVRIRTNGYEQTDGPFKMLIDLNENQNWSSTFLPTRINRNYYESQQCQYRPMSKYETEAPYSKISLIEWKGPASKYMPFSMIGPAMPSLVWRGPTMLSSKCAEGPQAKQVLLRTPAPPVVAGLSTQAQLDN